MIDIHSHIIPNVDDGSKSLEASIELLKEEVRQGVTDIILTPHHRHRMFKTSAEDISQSFFLLKEKKDELGIPLNLYLGQEIYIRRYDSLKRNLDEVSEKKAFTFGKSKYVLLEFSYTEDIDISEIVYMTKRYGYLPIIAHVERYQYIKSVDDVSSLVSAGALIQVNASSIVGRDGIRAQMFINKLIKNNLVHFVSSDIHVGRVNYMEKAYKKISLKHGKKIADDIFENNARNILLDAMK